MTHQNLRLVKCWKLYRATLSSGRQVNGHSKLFNLSPVLIEGTIRVGGRIRYASIPFDAVHPMLLPKDPPVCTSIVSTITRPWALLAVSKYSLPCARNFGHYKQDHLSVEFCSSV